MCFSGVMVMEHSLGGINYFINQGRCSGIIMCRYGLWRTRLSYNREINGRYVKNIGKEM